jgi:hypothetical protein
VEGSIEKRWSRGRGDFAGYSLPRHFFKLESRARRFCRIFTPSTLFQAYTKAIDRRSDWGNPYIVGTPGVPDRQTTARLYERDLLAGNLRGYRSGRSLTVRAAKKELWGFDLVCSGCKEDSQPCHGDVLLHIANE